jgi:hypothetical protein
MESWAVGSVDRTELAGPVLRAADPVRFLTDDERVTLNTDVVDSVLVAMVSTGTVAAPAAVEDAVAVSAADCSGRAHAAASITAEKAPAIDSLIIDRCREQSEAPWVCAASRSPILL